jgi:hypothetical protein
MEATMPHGPTTSPALGDLIRTCAQRLAATFPATADELHSYGTEVDAVIVDLGEIRGELDDINRLAANRLAAMDDLRAELVNARTLTRIANHRVADRTHKLAALVAYVDAQPCTCSEHELRSDPDAEPCDRCKALGRRNDEPVEQ